MSPCLHHALRVRREELKIESFIVGGMDKKVLQACFEREAAMSLQDQVVAETNEARNQLESYCLEMRSRIEDDLSEYVPKDVSEKFCAQCTEFEDWLYDEGEDAQKSENKAKLEILKKVGDLAVKREFEASHREAEVGALKKEIGHWEQLAASEDEKYAHIEAAERTKVTEGCRTADQWLATELSKQDKLTKAQDPSLTCATLQSKVAQLRKEAA